MELEFTGCTELIDPLDLPGLELVLEGVLSDPLDPAERPGHANRIPVLELRMAPSVDLHGPRRVLEHEQRVWVSGSGDPEGQVPRSSLEDHHCPVQRLGFIEDVCDAQMRWLGLLRAGQLVETQGGEERGLARDEDSQRKAQHQTNSARSQYRFDHGGMIRIFPDMGKVNRTQARASEKYKRKWSSFLIE